MKRLLFTIIAGCFPFYVMGQGGLTSSSLSAPNSSTNGGGGGGGTTVVNAGQGITVTGPSTNVTVNAIGDGSGLTNLNFADGGKVTGGIARWGSPTGENPAQNVKYIYVNGSSNGYALGSDPQIRIQNFSTNPLDSGGGITISVMGGDDGTGKASVISDAGGFSLVDCPTNRIESLMPGWLYTVHNNATVNKSQRGIAFTSPAYPNNANSDTWNRAMLMLDTENGYARFPLININSDGLVQPDSVVYQITVTNVTTKPSDGVTGNMCVYSNNGSWFTGYSNNISGGSGSWMIVGSFGAPAASGTFTKIIGTGDSTITFLASSVLRTWNGDAMTIRPNGTVGIFSNTVITNGHIQLLQVSTNKTGGSSLNIFSGANNQGAALSFGNINNPMGIGEMLSRAVYSFQLGAGTEPFMDVVNSTHPVNNGYFTSSRMAQVTFGGVGTLIDSERNSFADLGVMGSFGSFITNVSGNYSVTIDDSTIVVKASGVAVITLPDITSPSTNHTKGRWCQIINDGSTNVTVSSTSSQVIGNNTAATSITLTAGQSVVLQSDGVKWDQAGGSFGGSGTVTSVSLTTPSYLTVSGSPVTTSGTLAITGNGNAATFDSAVITNTITSYNGVTTAGFGLSPIVASLYNTSITSNITNATLFTSPSGASDYELSGSLITFTVPTLITNGVTVSYQDEAGQTITNTLLTGAITTAVGSTNLGPINIDMGSAQALKYSTTTGGTNWTIRLRLVLRRLQ